ncbi:MAG: DEAD/DEAH box helicase [Nitrospirae bacterium]|nr:DEAD/DEAH box helicase [Nitrospirota bacterium]
MNSLLRNWIAQMESWEAASEFGIPSEEWARYDVIKRNDDVYIASLSGLFDSLRNDNALSRQSELWSIAKTLLVYSRGSVSSYLSGVQRDLNQLYSAALFYLAGFPATATFLAKPIRKYSSDVLEEKFLVSFFCHDVSSGEPLSLQLAAYVEGSVDNLSTLGTYLTDSLSKGLSSDPRQFIAAKLASKCIDKFANDNIWKLLRENTDGYSHEAWRDYFSAGIATPIWELLPSQMTAITQGLLRNIDVTFSLQMPTSAGKTALCELLIYNEVKVRGRAVLFLVPFRALAAEIHRGMSRRLHSAGIRIVATHGGNIPSHSESASVEDADVLIITPEKFAALEQAIEGLADRFFSIICDEGHLIDDRSRGLSYELLLTRLRNANVPGRRFVFLSAILPNVDEIHSWLGGSNQSLVKSEYKPVDMDYGFLTKTASGSYRLDMNPTEPQPRNYILHRFLVKDDFKYMNLETQRYNLFPGRNTFLSLACAASLKARRTGPVALFTTTRGENGVQALGEKIHEMIDRQIRAAQEGPTDAPSLPELHDYFSFLLGAEHLLTRLVKLGVAYHHGRLPQEMRRAIEEGVQDGTIHLIICTTTLAEGVNLPIRTMVVHTVRRYNRRAQAQVYIQRRSIKNIIGRAGRAGKETRGRIMFINSSERAYVEQVLRGQNLERATGMLFKLIEELYEFSISHNQVLTNELFEQQQPWFLSLIDSIDYSLIELISSDVLASDVDQQLAELLDKTLASHFCSTVDLRNILTTVFRLRAAHLTSTVDRMFWPTLKKSGTTPRFWKFVVERALLQHPLWMELLDPLDDLWLHEVIIPLIEFVSTDVTYDQTTLQEYIKGWMSGKTYYELSSSCSCSVDEILNLVCHEVGFVLQDLVAKLCQLAIETHGIDNLSEVARSWSSLLQYGLSSLQQLDLFDKGISDRLGAWGMLRYIEANQINLRGIELISLLRRNGPQLRLFLEADGRVPLMSIKRIIRELRLVYS